MTDVAAGAPTDALPRSSMLDLLNRFIIELREAGLPVSLTENLADQIARIVRSIRQLELKKAPSVSETIDWAKTLLLLNVEHVDAQIATDTVNILLKYKSDITKAEKELATNVPAAAGS